MGLTRKGFFVLTWDRNGIQSFWGVYNNLGMVPWSSVTGSAVAEYWICQIAEDTVRVVEKMVYA